MVTITTTMNEEKVHTAIASLPRPSLGGGGGGGGGGGVWGGRPGIHCMRLCYIFRIIYRKSSYNRCNSYHVLTSEMVHMKNTG